MIQAVRFYDECELKHKTNVCNIILKVRCLRNRKFVEISYVDSFKVVFSKPAVFYVALKNITTNVSDHT